MRAKGIYEATHRCCDSVDSSAVHLNEAVVASFPHATTHKYIRTRTLTSPFDMWGLHTRLPHSLLITNQLLYCKVFLMLIFLHVVVVLFGWLWNCWLVHRLAQYEIVLSFVWFLLFFSKFSAFNWNILLTVEPSKQSKFFPSLYIIG